MTGVNLSGGTALPDMKVLNQFGEASGGRWTPGNGAGRS
jgi:hypothetical protein